MIKRLGIFILLLAIIATNSLAQITTNEKVLKLSSQKLKLEQELNYAKALSLAKTNKWDLSISVEGGIAKLTGVDDFGFPVYTKSFNNTTAAATTKASQLWPGGASGLNLTGSTTAMRNKLGVWEFDGAPLASHVEFSGRLAQKDMPTGSSGNDHATHVAGTMIAAGINPIAKGMAYGIPNLISYDHNSDIAEMTAEAAAGLLISNHSYGFIAGWNYNTAQSRWEFYGRPDENEDYRYGYYGIDAQRVDSIAFNAPFYLKVSVAGNDRNNNGPEIGQPFFRRNAQGTMVAAGNRPAGINSNDGFDIILGYGIAKNNLTIGAVNGIPGGYNKPSDVVMSAFSGWGPTDDGRIKPDLVANGVSVTSASTNGNTSYSTKSGTSMAGPNAAGSLLLLQEHYTKLKPGSFMRAATLKGLAIHTADEAGNTPGPDYTFGWGLMNMQRAAAVLTSAITSNNANNSEHLVYENILNSGQTFTKTVVATGKVPLTATITWTDPPASVNTDAASNLNDRTKKLIHDLDIKITRGATQTFLPWALDVSSPSSAASKRDNSIDNVERVDVDSTVPGETYTITISNKGNLVRGSQAYSLIVSGTGGVSYANSAALTGGAKVDSLSFTNIQFKNSTGCKTFSDNTRFTGNIQARQVLPIFIRTAACDATINPRIVKVYIDYNNDGDFADPNEQALVSTIQSGASSDFTGNITIPDNVAIGTIHRMRVITQETSTASDIVPTGTYARGETQDYLLKIQTPSNDVSVSNITSPAAGSCDNSKQYVTIAIANNGSNPQTNVPVTVTIKNGATTVATLNATYTGTIAALSEVEYTIQTPFDAQAGINYTINAESKLAADQNSTNNIIEVSVPIAARPDVPVAQGVICDNTAILKVTNPGTANYFWYADATTTTPFATGSSVTTSNLPADRTYYVAREARGTVGAASKLTFTGGGYNAFAGNYMKFNHTTPFKLESVRMYTANPGKIKITVGDNLTAGSTAGSYSYRPLLSKTYTVFNSRPTATAGSLSENDRNDSGFVYNLNMDIPGNGDKIMIVECTEDANVYRNNGITGTIYPFGMNGVMSFTGNSVSLAPQAGQDENQFWYFFYDTKISTGCTSNRVPIIAAPNATLTLSQVGDSLVSNIKTGVFQWVYNDTASVAGAIGSSIKPTRSGNYKIIVIDALGCIKTSANVNYTVTAINTVDPQEIKLSVSPNPNNGVFQLSFEVTKRSDLSIEILNASGQRVFLNTQSGFLGKYSKQLSLKQFSSEFYLLKIQHDKKTYLQKILIQR